MQELILRLDGLFFNQYTSEDTLKSQWFLVQINHDETLALNMKPETTDDYHVIFLSHHPSDNHLCDDNTRWWSSWYEYVVDENNIPVYGSRILLGPNRKPNLKK